MPTPLETDWYRLGDGYLGLRSEHLAFRRRFERLFGACREIPPDTTSAPVVKCDVSTPAPGHLSLIRFDDPEPLDVVAFALKLFADRGCHVMTRASFAGTSFGLGTGGAAVVVGCVDHLLIANNSEPWEWLIGNIAVHRLLRLQTGVAVFHAGSIAMEKHGILIVGPRGSGKTTVSLALAGRGHGFLGDEMAALRLESFELIPLRRSVSIRPGPKAAQVDVALQAAAIPPEPFPDGALRIRTKINTLFPGNTADPVRLSAIVFLRDLRAVPRLDPIIPRREHLKLLTPLLSTLWNMTTAQRAVRLLGILPRARCFRLDVGEADATAHLLEKAIIPGWV